MDIEVGDVVSIAVWTDCNSYDVISIKGKRMKLRRRRGVMLKEGKCIECGFAAHWYENPVWGSVRCEDNPIITLATLRKDGKWHEKGRPLKDFGGIVKKGDFYFRDMNF